MVFSGKSFDSDGALLAKIVGGSLRERPFYKCFGGNNFFRGWLLRGSCLGHNRVLQINLEVNISALGLKDGVKLFLINPDVSTFLCFFNRSWASFKETTFHGCV